MKESRAQAWLVSLLAALGGYFVGSLAGFIVGPDLGLLFISSAALLGSFSAVAIVYATAPRWSEQAAIAASVLILFLSWLVYGNTTYKLDPSSWILWREWLLPRPVDGAAIGSAASSFLVGVLWLIRVLYRGKQREPLFSLTARPAPSAGEKKCQKNLATVANWFLSRLLLVSLAVIGGFGIGHYTGIAITGQFGSWGLSLASFLSAFLGMFSAFVAAPESRRAVPTAVLALIAAFAVFGHGLGPSSLYVFDQTRSVAYYLDRPFIFLLLGAATCLVMVNPLSRMSARGVARCT